MYGRVCFCFWYDNTSVAGVAFRFFRASAQACMAQFLCNVAILLSYTNIFDHAHIHGHCGHPWNELADKLCDSIGAAAASPYINSALVCKDFAIPVSPISKGVPWMFLAGIAGSRVAEYPGDLASKGTFDTKSLEINQYIPASTIAKHFDLNRSDSASKHGIATKSAVLHAYCHNALTLRTARKFAIAVGQLEQKGFHLAGFQESGQKHI